MSFALKYAASVIAIIAAVSGAGVLILSAGAMPAECHARPGSFDEILAPSATPECREALEGYSR